MVKSGELKPPLLQSGYKKRITQKIEQGRNGFLMNAQCETNFFSYFCACLQKRLQAHFPKNEDIAE